VTDHTENQPEVDSDDVADAKVADQSVGDSPTGESGDRENTSEIPPQNDGERANDAAEAQSEDSSAEPISAELKSVLTPEGENDDDVIQGEPTSGEFDGDSVHDVEDDSEPILAEAAREAPNPFRFDLRAMFALTLLIGALFALIRYFGTMYGLLMGAGFCCVTLVLLIIAGIILHKRHDQPLMVMFDRLAIRLTAGVVILLIAVFFAGGGSLGVQWYQARAVAKQLNADLGFTAKSGPVRTDYQFENMLIIESVVPGSAFDKAGIKKGDVIVTDLNPKEWHAMLEANRGKTVEVVVAVDGENNSLDRCVQESHEIQVPK